MKRTLSVLELTTEDDMKNDEKMNQEKRIKKNVKSPLELPDDVFYEIFKYMTSKDWVKLIMGISNKDVYLWCKTPYFIKAITWHVNVHLLQSAYSNKNNKSPCVNILKHIEKMVLYSPKYPICSSNTDIQIMNNKEQKMGLASSSPSFIGTILIKHCYENLKELTLVDCSITLTKQLYKDMSLKKIQFEHSIELLALKNASLKFDSPYNKDKKDGSVVDPPMKNLKCIYSDIESLSETMKNFDFYNTNHESNEKRTNVYICPHNSEKIFTDKWKSLMDNLRQLKGSHRLDNIHLDQSYPNIFENSITIRVDPSKSVNDNIETLHHKNHTIVMIDTMDRVRRASPSFLCENSLTAIIKQNSNIKISNVPKIDHSF